MSDTIISRLRTLPPQDRRLVIALAIASLLALIIGLTGGLLTALVRAGFLNVLPESGYRYLSVHGVSAFFSDMLVYEKFEDMSKDPIIYPRFNMLVAKDLSEQLRLMILDTVLTRNQDDRELFTTRRTFLTRRLGAFYGARIAGLRD